MPSSFEPATREATKARIALAGPSGSGKTYTGLTLACALGDKVAVIDTERRSASKYEGVNGWKFDTATPVSFAPDALTRLLGEAGTAAYDVVVVDSLSHYWMGVDGMLEQVDRRQHGSNSFSGWKEVRPDERRMIDALISYPGHVIVTLRTKTEWVIEQNDKGKSVPRKVGLKPEQREGIEYEFDIVGDLDLDNTLTVSKTRCPALNRAVIREPSTDLAETVLTWLGEGADTKTAADYLAEALDPATTAERLREMFREVRRLQLLGAAVEDEAGTATTLGELITAKGYAAAKSESSPEAAESSDDEPEVEAEQPKLPENGEAP